MAKARTYKQIKQELDEVLIKLQDPETDLDDAIKLHEKGKLLIAELEKYLAAVDKKS